MVFSFIFDFFFSFFSLRQPASLQQLTSLYVARATAVWKDSEILPWFERNVNAVLDRVDAKDPIVAEYSTKRTQRYVPKY